MALHAITLPAIIHSFPAPLQTPTYPFPSRMALPAPTLSPSPAGTREGTTQCPPSDHQDCALGGSGSSHRYPLLPSVTTFHPHPHIDPREAPDPGRVVGGGGKVRGAALGPGSHFLAQSLSLCGKLLKVIKHPEVVKCPVNEVLINTPQEKIKRYH